MDGIYTERGPQEDMELVVEFCIFLLRQASIEYACYDTIMENVDGWILL
jgi:hypothetical protein